MFRLGIVSDTHGWFDPSLPDLLKGCDLIAHAGDVGDGILEELSAIAPVRAVLGNSDHGPMRTELPRERVLTLEGLSALVIHDLDRATEAIAATKPRLVIHGHTHQPGVRLSEGILFVNPGSAGPKRAQLPRSAGRLTVEGQRVEVELFDLESDGMIMPSGGFDLGAVSISRRRS